MPRLRTDDRIVIVGGTGDGKTTLALKILARLAQQSGDPVIVLNPGAEERLYELFGEARFSIDSRFPPVQHVTPVLKKRKAENGNLFWPQILRGNVLTYIDEVFPIADVKNFSLGLQYLFQAGRRRNCGTVAVSQRPVAIPTFLFEMSDHLFVGDVRGAALNYLEYATNQEWSGAIQKRKQFEFLYWSRHVKSQPEVMPFG